VEPQAPSRWRPLFLLLAVVLAAVGWLLAPRDWPAGEGSLALRLQGQDADSVAIVWGSDEPVVVQRTIGEDRVRIELPQGAPVDGRVVLNVGVMRAGEIVRPSLQDVTIRVSLPDGRQELVPVTRWDPAEQVLVAERRPAQKAGVALGLLGLVIVLWVSGVIPLFVTSLVVPVVLVLGGAGEAADALAPFFHPIIALFFAGFLMAEAMRRVGLDERIATSLLARASGGPRALFATMLATAAFLSMWMSNTAAVSLMIPIALAVTQPLESPGYQRATILGVAYAATAGGVGSPIGSPANLLAIEFLDSFADREITFAAWFGYGLPVLLVLVPLIGMHVWRRMDVKVDPALFHVAQRVARDAAASAERIGRRELEVIGVLLLVAATWLTAAWHGLNTGIVALAGVIVLSLLGHVLPEDLNRISWSSLLTFGGGLTLGLFLTNTGVADWIATRLGAAAGLPDLVAIAMVAVVALVMTAVASNTAAAAMLVPLAISLAAVLGLDPTLLVLVVAIASSVDFALVIGTPPTMLAYSTGLFTPVEILRAGIMLDLAGVGVTIAVATLLWPLLGLV
jgi:sodium-dependent dicarboxylate transporter 2/3/5